MIPVVRPFRFYVRKHFVSFSYTHRIADPPALEQTCSHALIVRWSDGWRGIVWQVQQ